jgi:Ca-activated chloride channel family protein
LVVAAAVAQAPAPPRVRFLSPTRDSVVFGPTRIEVEVVPGDAEVEKVEIRVDGKLIASLVQPPYEIVWTSGSAVRAHRFQAWAYDAEGRRGMAEVHSRFLPAGEVVEVVLVNLYAAVVDPQGDPVDGLSKADFELFEDGVPQTIEAFSTDAGALNIALVVDTSRSMRDTRIEAARKAAHAFLERMAPEDRAMILAFNEELEEVREWTSSRGSLDKGLEALETGGGTALYDALYGAASRLQSVQGRKGMILLSDGRDESYDGLGPGSLRTFEEALEAVARSEVTLYTIGLGRNLDREMDFTGRHTLEELLERAAARTGGRSYFSSHPRQLKKVYEEVSRDLRHQYWLSYYPDLSRRDGKWREIELRVRNPQFEVRTRAGFFAPSR